MRYTLDYLEGLPTIHRGHFDDIKLETPAERVLLSRMTVEDGQPYNDQVIIVKLIKGYWKTVKTYQAR